MYDCGGDLDDGASFEEVLAVEEGVLCDEAGREAGGVAPENFL